MATGCVKTLRACNLPPVFWTFRVAIKAMKEHYAFAVRDPRQTVEGQHIDLWLPAPALDRDECLTRHPTGRECSNGNRYPVPERGVAEFARG